MIDYKYAEAITSIILGEEDGNKLADKQLHSLHEIYARARHMKRKASCQIWWRLFL